MFCDSIFIGQLDQWGWTLSDINGMLYKNINFATFVCSLSKLIYAYLFKHLDAIYRDKSSFIIGKSYCLMYSSNIKVSLPTKV